MKELGHVTNLLHFPLMTAIDLGLNGWKYFLPFLIVFT